jgi:hypothetical protein
MKKQPPLKPFDCANCTKNRENFSLDFFYFFQKLIDKCGKMWYNKRLGHERGGPETQAEAEIYIIPHFSNFVKSFSEKK